MIQTRVFLRNLIAVAALSLLGLPGFSQTSTEDPGMERITHFHSTMRVQKDCRVKITEKISVVSRGIQIRHGIYRDLPLYYDYQGGRTDVGFKLLEVKLDGVKEDHHTDWLDNGIRIYMGSEDLVLEEGRYTFELTYEVDHVLGFFKNYDELFWNINGTGWLFQIDSLTAEMYYPEGAGLKQFSAYTGRQGEAGKDFTAEKTKNGMIFRTTRPLEGGENLTVAVAWEKNHLTYPTGWDEFVYWVRSHFLWIVAGLGLLLTLIYNSRIWYLYGRDPKPGTIMPQYEAPQGFTPADAAFLYNYGRKNANMFTGQLIALATKGRLKIHVDEGGMFSRKTYTLTKTTPERGKIAELLPLEEQFYSLLFGYGDTIVFKQGTYQPVLKNAQDELVEQVADSQGETYILKRNRYKLQQFIIPAIALGIGLLGMLYFGGNVAIPLVGFGVCCVINIIFGRLFEQPTVEGRKRLDELAGYKMYMQYADSERIRLMNPPTLNFEEFEKNLPYAIALDVANEWSQKFDQAELQRATSSGHYWYTGAMLMGMHHHAFDFSDLSSTISSASTPPSSSSSGSGGGGFSGGGGGGGGGGGW
jgi:uncharacterized membrane protein YgcG